MAKERRTINVSLQSKKYLEPVNKILNDWEEDSLNLSTQICDNILLVNQLKKSVTFGNVLAVYELIERMIKVYHIDDESQLEKIFSSVVTVDNGRLTYLLSQFNNSTSKAEPVQTEIAVEKKTEVVESKPTEVVETFVAPNTENKTQEVDNEISVTKEDDDDDFGIPLDFLLNG